MLLLTTMSAGCSHHPPATINNPCPPEVPGCPGYVRTGPAMETDQACVRQCDSTEQSCLMVCEAKRTNSSRWRWGLLAAARDNPEW
jgi:hypothetical protein